MTHLLSPILLYVALSIGAVGVFLAMPRNGGGPQIIGALIAAAGGGLLLLGLALAAGADHPSLYFYIFSFIALGASLRVITQPRPVYAALYFILTILATSGMFILLAAEFLTFALVIIYAGAILITYLFVIMLATEAPTEERLESLRPFDATSQAPVLATLLGFLLLGALTSLLNVSGGELAANNDAQRARLVAANQGEPAMALLREKAKTALIDVGFPGDISVVAVSKVKPYLAYFTTADAAALDARIAAARATQTGAPVDQGVESLAPAALATLAPSQAGYRRILPDGRAQYQATLPLGIGPSNIEAVGVGLLNEHPLALELAGVLLLMAMVSAVVLARHPVKAGLGGRPRPLLEDAA